MYATFNDHLKPLRQKLKAHLQIEDKVKGKYEHLSVGNFKSNSQHSESSMSQEEEAHLLR